MDCSDKHKLKAAEVKEKLLVETAAAGDWREVKDLLDSGVSVDADEYNRTLFYASKNYVTPLQVAAAAGHTQCVKLLIRYGANVDSRDRFDVTALHMSAEKGHLAALKLLLEASADCCVTTKYSKKGYYTAVPHLGGTTALHLAASHDHVACVRELIQYGADYNAVDEQGRTSLYIAAQAGNTECVLAHLKHAVGRDILSLPGFETGDTPLHFAVSRGMVECVRELLGSGSDVCHHNYSGVTPLHLAVATYNDDEDINMEILQLLVLHGYNADVNVRDGSDLSLLHYCCFDRGSMLLRRPEMAKFLISYGASVNIKNHRGYSLIECEFRVPDPDFSVLRHIVKSMLHPPPPNTLKIGPHYLPRGVTCLPTQFFSALFSFSPGVAVEPPPHASQDYNNYMLEKHRYYHGITSNPRTLQHYCRYSIRSALGHKRLRNIKDLPLPVALQSYLLLECEE